MAITRHVKAYDGLEWKFIENVLGTLVSMMNKSVEPWNISVV